jgi:hypothetical protein
MDQPDPLARRSAISQRWRNSVSSFHGLTMRHCPSADSKSPRSILRQPAGVTAASRARRMKLAAVCERWIVQDAHGALERVAPHMLIGAKPGLLGPPR